MTELEIGIIGAGNIGGTLARRLSELGHHVRVANSRGPQTLADLAAETGATAATVADAVAGADLVVVTVPTKAVAELPAVFDGVTVVDTCNYYPRRDGRIEAIEAGTPSSRWVQEQLRGSTVVKAFNNEYAARLGSAGRPVGTPGRAALPVAGDDAAAKRVVMDLVDGLGFDPVDAGGLDESWRQEPDTPVYGRDDSAEEVRRLLEAATRGD